MTEEIIERLEEYLGSEEFEYEAENCMEELDESGEGINAVLPLLRFLERHRNAAIDEGQDGEEFEDVLIDVLSSEAEDEIKDTVRELI